MTHPSRRLDDAVHQRTRLGILAVLAEAERIEFTRLRDTLELTDGNLSGNLSRLTALDLVAVDKRPGGKARTWVAITPAGREALAAEVAALRELIDRVDVGKIKPSRRREPRSHSP